MEIDELKSIKSLGEESTYKFLGVLENSKQEDKLVLENASKEYLRRLAIIWSSPLSDHSRVVATNQYALPVLSYLMWTQTWPLAQLQQVDREARKIIVQFGGKHPQGSTAILYMSRKCGGRGLRSVETTYKDIKIKAAMKLYHNPDPSMEAVRLFEEKAVRGGRHSAIKDARRYAEELGLHLKLEYPEPMCVTDDGKEVNGKKVKGCIAKVRQEEVRAKVKEEKWQGKMICNRWEDVHLEQGDCFAWLSCWKAAPTQVVVSIQELYEQLLSTKVFYHRKVGTSGSGEEKCRMCGKATESVPHILAGCGALAQTLYLARHNNALKILFFQVIRALDLVTSEVPWFSKIQPKPMYENERAIAYWDIPLYADNTHVKANRIDATIVAKENKKVSVIEMSCPWVENREEKDAEKTTKYGPLRWELEQRYPEYRVKQFNIIVDVLGGYSRDVRKALKELVGDKSDTIALQIQKSVITSSLNIARRFKLLK
ncbi:uncharacterized protein [Montipora capricornis]|uniref:uncharacterized protein n=1 Tax=Montipora capricornis TaxID=246305 RepID=UPI0035F1BD9B